MENFIRDLRYAFRGLIRQPVFSLVIIVSLALGIGASTIIFTLVNSAFLSPLPVQDEDTLVAVLGLDDHHVGHLPHSFPNFEDLRDNNSVLETMVAYRWSSFALIGGDRPERIFGQYVSTEYFDLLGVDMGQGRSFTNDDDLGPGTGPVVVLSHGLWQRRFGGDPDLLGKDIEINNRQLTVVGIGPQGFAGTDKITACELWVPMSMFDTMSRFGPNKNERVWRIFDIYGRLADGVSIEQANSNLKSIMATLREGYPDANETAYVKVLPLAHSSLGGVDDRKKYVLGASLLMVAVGLILLIACGNAASLLLIRATARRREIATRLAAGASRLALVRLLLTESIVLGALGGLGGLLLTLLVSDRMWQRLKPVFINDLSTLAPAIDFRVFVFALAISILSGVLFGLAPVVQAWKTDLMAAIRDREANSLWSNRWYGLRNLLVIFQIALALVTLIGAGLLLGTFKNFKKIDAGYDYDRLVAMSFEPGARGYDPAQRWNYYRDVMAKTLGIPSVTQATISARRPLERAGLTRRVRAEDDETSGTDEYKLPARADVVSETYFETLGIPIVSGRGVRETDGPTHRLVAVINETMAARLWPDEDAVGRRFFARGVDDPIEVIGVAADSKYVEIGEEPIACFYRPLAQVPIPAGVLYARLEGDPRSMVETIRREVQSLDERMPIVGPLAIVDRFYAKQWAPRLGAALMASFGALALFMTMLGIYGTMAYNVNRRRREIGIRMAVGGQRSNVMLMILGQALQVAAIGCCLGLFIAWYGGQVVESVLYGVKARDLLIFFASTFALALAAFLAALLPSWLAIRIQPSQVLREE